MAQIKVAIVGCGRISELHELGYRDRNDVQIVAVCDKRRKLAQEKAQTWNVSRIYENYDELLAQPDIDLVELIVPHHLHAKMTIAACAAGKHVSVQKPMALNVSEAQQMEHAAKTAGVILRVYENYIFYPPFVRAKEMLDAGEIGEPKMLRIHFNDSRPDLGWKVQNESVKWRLEDEHCGGGPVVFDHGYHLFSVAHYLMGPVERVSAWIDRTPIGPNSFLDSPATIMFEFKGRRRYGVMDYASAPEMHIESKYYTADERVEIIGERGILFINRCTARSVDLPALMLFRDGKTTAISVDRVEWHDSFIDCTRHLLDVLKNGGEPKLDAETGKKVLQFSLAAHQSAKSGLAVRPDDVV